MMIGYITELCLEVTGQCSRWSMISGYTLERYAQKSFDDIQMIRKVDLENHNKDGGLWVVIHGKVYDIHDFKSQALCGREILMEYAGE